MKAIVFLMSLLCCQIVFSQDQMYNICPLKVGEEIPNTSLVNDDNKEISLFELISNKPTVIIFYRGAWCGNKVLEIDQRIRRENKLIRNAKEDHHNQE